MSYDLDLFTPQANIDPITILQQAALEQGDPLTPQNEAILRHLEADNPRILLSRTHQHIEICDPDDGVRISLYGNAGHVAIPYWHTDPQTINLMFGSMRRYLRAVLAITGYAVYDPQLGRVVNVESELPIMLDRYRWTQHHLQRSF